MFTLFLLAQESAPATLQDFEGVFATILGLAVQLAGIVLFFVFLFGGFRYLTSGSDPGKVEAAKKTLTYAILGMVLFALAYLILVIIANFTGAGYLLNFRIYLGS